MTSLSINPRIYLNEQPPAPPTPPAPQPPTADEVYQAVDALLIASKEAMQQDPAAREQLKQISSEVKATFKADLTGLAEVPQTAEDCRLLALNALAAGMLAGALDGAVLMHADAASQVAAPRSQSNPEGIGEDIGKAIDRFFEELQQKLAEAVEKMKEVGSDALQAASAQGKEFGSQAVDESERLVGANKLQAQAYLATVFGLGYAIGGIDAAIVMIANQVPGQEG